MSWIKSALAELFSLFVDDVWFSVAILLWVGLGVLEMPNLPIDPDWDAPLLFAGCAAILVVSTWRAAKRAKKVKN